MIYFKMISQIKKMYLKGMSVKEIHGKTGAPTRSLQRWLKTEIDNKKKNDDEKLMALLSKNLTQIKMAKELGISQACVSKKINKLEYERKVYFLRDPSSELISEHVGKKNSNEGKGRGKG